MSVKVNIDLQKMFRLKTNILVENAALQLIEALKDATPVDTGKARDGWQYKDGKIINDVEYINELNAGHSKQAPAHFVERTLLNHSNVNPNGVIVT